MMLVVYQVRLPQERGYPRNAKRIQAFTTLQQRSPQRVTGEDVRVHYRQVV